MKRLVVAPIVEGHGEVAAVPELLRRIWFELVGGYHIQVLRPIREHRASLFRNVDGAFERAIRLARGKLASESAADTSALILAILDADKDLPCLEAPRLTAIAQPQIHQVNFACVFALPEYESWFVAAAASLNDCLTLKENDLLPINPEAPRRGKGWIEARFNGPKYSESLDQVRLTAKMDLLECRRNCPSFDKLCRELERFK